MTIFRTLINGKSLLSCAKQPEVTHHSLQHCHLLGEDPDDVAFAKCTGQQVTVGGTHSSQSAGNEESMPWPKQCSRQHVLDITRKIDSKKKKVLSLQYTALNCTDI